MEKTSALAEKAKRSFQKFKDTAKLKLHLASMDTKDTWQRLEQQLETIGNDIRDFSQAVKQESDETRLKGHLALMDAKERWEGLQEDLDHWVSTVGQSAEAKVNAARLELTLGKMEARDFFNKAKHEADFHKLGKGIEDDWYSLLAKMDDRLVNFIDRFPLK